MKEYYKLLRFYKGRLRSLIARGPASIIYYPNIWVGPPNRLWDLSYGLFVFDSFESIELFDFVCPGDIQVWKCRIGTNYPLPRKRSVILAKDHHKHWKIYNSNDKYFTLLAVQRQDFHLWPDGAIMTDKVMLTNRIY